MDLPKTKTKYYPFRSNKDWLKNMRMIIESKHWNFPAIEYLVSINSSLLNVPEYHRKTILEVMVVDDRGTEDIVQFLIDNGAEVNALDGGRMLLKALRYCRCRPGIIKVLIENGVNIIDDYGGVSALSEAIYEEYKEDVLKMIIDKRVDVNHVNQLQQSLLCRALSCGRELEVIKLLLDSGAKVAACEHHKSPLHCLASAKTIRTKHVELLIENGAGGGNVIVDDFERTVLHNALRHSNYEERAMCILVGNEIDDIEARDMKDSTFLHDALWNPGCTLEVVKLLIEKGAGVNKVDCTGETPLHKSVLIRPCDIEIVRHLLQEGSAVNVSNRVGETASVIAIKKRQNLSVIKLLLSSGERVQHMGSQSLSTAMTHFSLDRNVENMILLQTLAKYAFLENPGISFREVIESDCHRCVDPNAWLLFWNTCLREVEKMVIGRTWRRIPLLNILGYGTKTQLKNSYDSLSELDNKRILLLIRNVQFPLYAEILKAKLGYQYIIDAFPSIHLEAPYRDETIEKISVLTRHCLQYIGGFLSRDEKLRMIILSS